MSDEPVRWEHVLYGSVDWQTAFKLADNTLKYILKIPAQYHAGTDMWLLPDDPTTGDTRVLTHREVYELGKKHVLATQGTG